MNRIVLMYHDIYCDSIKESGFQNISALQYKVQLVEFEKHVSAVTEYCKNHTDVTVEFTFDDGGVSFLTHAAPILEKYGLHGTFFISTNYLNTPLFLTTQQLKTLAEHGHRIGTHTHTHPLLTELSDEEISEEWNVSTSKLKNYIVGEITASIPNGDGNKTVVRKAAETGINVLYTSVPTTRAKTFGNMLIVGRYVIFSGMKAVDVMAIVESKNRRRMMYLRWQILQIIKCVLGKRYNLLKSFLFKQKSFI